MRSNLSKIKNNGKSGLKTFIKFFAFLLLTKPGAQLLKKKLKQKFGKPEPTPEDAYNIWIKGKLNPAVLQQDYNNTINLLTSLPKISIVVPVYNPPPRFLRLAIDSVISQLYTNWELCLADDCSPNPEIKEILSAYAAKDKRIKVVLRTENGHISACSNSALEIATGDYILFMDHDDLISTNCLFEVVKHINAHPENQIIYTDEDKIDDLGVYSFPYFKPDWAPDNLLSRNYIGHVVVMKKQLVNRLNGFREGFEGSQDHDLLLRATELTEAIGHIPKILYHWRIHNESVSMEGSEAKPYAYIAARKALQEAMIRRNTPANIEYIPDFLGGYRIKYVIKDFKRVSIIIPTKDMTVMLKAAIDSVYKLTDYPDYEIIVLNNNSTSKEFFELMHYYTSKHNNFKCIDAFFPFNFAKLINLGAASCTGDYVLMLNNDIEVIHKDWMSEMVSFAQHPHTGAVGVKLLYPNDTIQHAGTIIGLGDAAGHCFVHKYKNDLGYFNYLKSLNNYSAVTAACLMCRKSIFDEVGGMSEDLEIEYNDVDFCLKLLTHGYFNVYVPDVVLYHHESATRGHPFQSKESFANHQRDIGIFQSRWQHFIDNDPFYNPNLSLKTTEFDINYEV